MQRLRTRRVRALLIVVVVALLSASAALALSTQVEATKSLAVHDANGRLVGQGIDVEGGNPVVVLRIGERPVALTVNRSRFGTTGNTSGDALAFESTDCTGQAFIGGAPDAEALFPFVVLTSQRLYAPTDAERTFHLRAFLHSDGFCEPFDAENFTMFEAELLVDLASEFQPPFELRVK